nr:MAG: Hsp90 [Sedum sarmentosum crinivirus]
MEPIDSSERVRHLFTCVFKRKDVSGKLSALNSYLVKNVATENRNYYRTTIGTRDHVFSSSYSVSGGRVFVESNDNSQVVKLIIIYMYRIEPELLKKTNYNPENLFASLKIRDFTDDWLPYLDKDANDYLSDHPKEGCLFSMDDIVKHYPSEDSTAQLTLYRVCNSLGRLISVAELKEGKINAFRIETKQENADIGEGLSSNKLFKECVETLQSYLLLNSSRAGREKIKASAKIFQSYLQSLTPKNLNDKLGTNPLILAKFVNEFSARTVSSRGFGDNFKAVKDLSPGLLIFIKRVFLIDASLNESVLFVALPKNTVVEILGDKFAVGEYLKIQSLIPTASNSSCLPPSVDGTVSTAIIAFFKKFGAFDDILPLDLILFIFGKMTTNSKRWRENHELLLSVGDTVIQSTTSDFLSFIQAEVRKKHPDFKSDNIIRQWANLRGDRAKQLFQLLHFRPGLFSQCPGILPHMRFDFFKMIDLSLCTQDEIESYQTLRRMTESRSNNSSCDNKRLHSWILRKS